MDNLRDLFRGKRLDNGEWVYGFPHTHNGKTLIVSENIIDFDSEFCAPEFWWVVDPATVGQCTGVRENAEGKLLFDGDIVEWTYHYKKMISQICWCEDNAKWFLYALNEDTDCNTGLIGDEAEEIYLVGNIHDNSLEIST
jgi:uncharacterized phage protein (TIGR01671 family)